MSKAAISRSNIARPTVASTDFRLWRLRPGGPDFAAAIIALAPPAALAAKAATTTIPIVFATGADPVAIGLVPSLNRPGGNVTGVTFVINSLGAKRLELLRQLMPNATIVGFLINPRNPTSEAQTADAQAAARALGVELLILHAGSEPDIDAAFHALRPAARERHDRAAPMHSSSVRPINWSGWLRAMRSRPSPFCASLRPWAGLFSYGASIFDAYRLAGGYTVVAFSRAKNRPTCRSSRRSNSNW